MKQLTPSERERIMDTVQKIQSARRSLDPLQKASIPAKSDIEDCLESADTSLRRVLGYAGEPRPK